MHTTTIRTIRTLTILLACSALAVGCDDTPAEDDGGGSGMDAATPVDSGAPADDGGTGPEDGGATPEDAGTTDSGAQDGGAGDSGTDPDDGGPADAGGDNGVECGDTVCAGSEICCVTFGGGAPSSTCTAPDACEGSIVTCNGPEDCGASEACCISFTGAPPAISISTMCGAPTDESCQLEACHTAADCTEAGMMCCPFMGLGNFCAAACPPPT